MIGAIAGDIIGSIYEGDPIKTKGYPLFSARSRFTDDTVLTVAVADAILSGRPYLDAVREYGRAYPGAGFSRTFLRWVLSDSEPYNSYGNGSAMRVSPVGWALDDDAEVLRQAEMTASISHDHPEGIKGAQATALAVSLGGDSDTLACITGAIAEAFYGVVGVAIVAEVMDRLPPRLRDVTGRSASGSAELRLAPKARSSTSPPPPERPAAEPEQQRKLDQRRFRNHVGRLKLEVGAYPCQICDQDGGIGELVSLIGDPAAVRDGGVHRQVARRYVEHLLVIFSAAAGRLIADAVRDVGRQDDRGGELHPSKAVLQRSRRAGRYHR
ncbi:MAG: hypothetical protein FJX72_13845 [Armatimonadetes bacterium]|nr:hypothetical protein [Armatimonadota bacterium]